MYPTRFKLWITITPSHILLQFTATTFLQPEKLLFRLKKYSEAHPEKKIVTAITTLTNGKKMLDRYVKAGAVALNCALKII